MFSVPLSKVEVLVHRQSIVHSMVEFCDNAVIAQMGVPDMKLPIVYAIHYPERRFPVCEKLDLFKCNTLTFAKPDIDTFECLGFAYDALKIGGTMPAVMNAANEIAVSRFLNDEIEFLQIPYIIRKTMDAHTVKHNISITDVINADLWAREYGALI